MSYQNNKTTTEELDRTYVERERERNLFITLLHTITIFSKFQASSKQSKTLAS